MRFREKISHEEYAQIARRALRLFLSVDIVNSTALKQEFRQREGESWIEVAHGFYTSFPSLLEGAIDRISSPLTDPVNTSPGLWKALGDELIFVAEVLRMEDLPPILKAFRETIQRWNLDFESKGISIKGAAWLAGFPVMNSAIVGDDVDHLDFLGLSMDVGFRLGHHATPRRFMLSVELAYVLAVLESDLVGELGYGGSDILKGVLRNRPYPVLSLDCYRAEVLPGFAALEVLSDTAFLPAHEAISAQPLREFLLAWMESSRGDICPPFCPRLDDVRFPIPSDYAERERQSLAELEREFLEVPQASESGGDDSGLDLADFDRMFSPDDSQRTKRRPDRSNEGDRP